MVDFPMDWQDSPVQFMTHVFGSSQVGTYVKNNFLAGERILGDSGCMLKSYLLTPYRQTASNAQENYNYSHKKRLY